MLPQSETRESLSEPANLTYGSYQENPEYSLQRNEIDFEPQLRAEAGGKVYSDDKNKMRLIWFAASMVALLAFAVVCLIFVGGTAGWISFCAASFTIMVIASTAMSAK